MRLLIVLAALAGCYSPTVDDCQFRCGGDSDCPDGTTCDGAFCRSSTTGECTGDLECPASTPETPSGCTTRFPIAGGCGVVCGSGGGGDQRSWTGARAACEGAGWELAILDTPSKLQSPLVGGGAYWVGASRLAVWTWNNGAPVDDEAWRNGNPPVIGADCAAFDGTSKRLVNSFSCGDSERWLCTVLVP